MRNRHAFTLVELSVVLVIIGLVVGGIISGQSLIKAQRLVNTLAEAGAIRTGMIQFETKYGGLPGDLKDAQRIWGNAEGGSVDTNCSNSFTAVGNGVSTCNGDGDGFVSDYEGFRLFQHLSNASLINGKYTGIQKPSGYAAANYNIPAGSIPLSAFYVLGWKVSVPPGPLSYGLFDSNNSTEHYMKNMLVLGKDTPGGVPTNALLSPQDAFSIDTKADDGMPGTGHIRPFVSACATSNDYVTARYDLANAQPACVLLFLETYKSTPQ